MPRVCNVERLKDISMGDDEFAGELVRVFLEDSADQLEKLRVAIERTDCQAAAEVAHRLKGSGANVGAEVLAEACQRLETAARARAVEGLAQRAACVDEEFERARSAFESELRVP
jgi:HPt (histidine-containing phosphotransfer) domain-containing protein